MLACNQVADPMLALMQINSLPVPDPWLPWLVALGASAVATGFDLRSRRIPNVLTATVFLSGLVYHGLIGAHPLSALGGAFLASLILALPFVLLFAFAGGGAGDAKLMGALGAWLGLLDGTTALLCVSLSGILTSMAWAASKGRLQHSLLNIRLAANSLFAQRSSVSEAAGFLPTEGAAATKMPYGLAILVGVSGAAAMRLS